MTRWLISIPVWGERYVDEFCATALPALERAVAVLMGERSVEVRLVIHTDQPDRLRGASAVPIELRPVPAGVRYFDCMSQAHREALSLGLHGDVVVLMTAGSVISHQGLTYCAEVFDNPRIMAVLCASPRVLNVGPVPTVADGVAMMNWAWTNRHPMTRECTWPEGKSADVSRTYFERDGCVATRQALPHPLAVRIDGRPLRFTPTIDANLIHCFDPIEMHMAVDCRRLAMVKMTPLDKGFQLSDKTMQQRLINLELVIPDPVQQWCLRHKVMLYGPPHDCDDDNFVNEIIELSK